MNDNLNMEPETPMADEDRRRAYPSRYLDRTSTTIMMVIKLAEGLSKLCLAILVGFVLQSTVTALNRIFQEGTTVADGKAMVAQFLKTLQVPKETIRQIVDAFPLNITFSSKPVVAVFIIALPFVLIAVLEAIAVIRLRLGKGGTRTIGILQMIYYVLGFIRFIALGLCAIALSIVTIIRVGGTLSIMLSTVYISLAGFFIITGLPALLYHRSIAGFMTDVRYEMETKKRAVRRPNRFNVILTILIVLEVIGAVVSFIASWNPEQGGLVAGLLIGTMIGPAAKLLKYICVMCCYKNFMQEGGSAEMEENISHTPQIILIILVTLFFAVPNIFLCVQSNTFANAIVERVEQFFSEARETVDDLSTTAQAQIEAVQAAVDEQTAQAAAAMQEGVKEESSQAAALQEGVKEESSQAAAPQEGTKGESAETTAPQAGKTKTEAADKTVSA